MISYRDRCRKTLGNYGILGGLTIASPILVTSASWAQVIPDQTLGTESSRVFPANLVQAEPGFLQVEGGAQRGPNLFHSFSEFNLPTREQLFFAPSDQVERIFARVTGSKVSTIDGLLGVRGEADLFLINPQGLFFGPNGVLDISGSFVGTTAEAVGFGNGSLFRTQPQPGEGLPLLTMQPDALVFGAPMSDAPEFGVIRNQAAVERANQNYGGLVVLPGEALLLVGRELLFDDGGLLIEGGRVELGAVAGAGAIALDPQTYELNLPDRLALGNITLRNNSQVVSNEGGVIRLHGSQIYLDHPIELPNVPLTVVSGTDPGEIEIFAQERLEVVGARGIQAVTSDQPGADIEIRTGDLIVRDGGSIATVTFGEGTAGNLDIVATRSAEVFGAIDAGAGGLGSRTTGSGQGGNITITTPRLSIRDGASVSASSSEESTAQAGDITVNADFVEVVGTTFTEQLFFSLLRTETFGPGDSGNLTVNAQTVSVRDGGTITTRAFGAATGQTQSAGKAGELTINATESIEVEGESPDAPFLGGNIISQTTAAGDAGRILLNTPRLSVRGGSFISSAAESGSTGQGGDLIVNAFDQVEISGRAQRLSGADGSIQWSQISSRTLGEGDAGKIKINTPRLQINDGGRITASSGTAARGGDIQLRQLQALSLDQGGQIQAIATTATGQAGSLGVEAERVELQNQSSLSVEATAGGVAGSLRVQAQQITVSGDSQLNVSSSSGIAGNLEVMGDRLILNNSRLNAETGQDNPTGKGAEIGVSLNQGGILLLRNGAQITASANDNAQGGNLRLDSQFIIAVPQENSDIRANAVRGQGGNVAIVSDRLFGIEPAVQPLLRSDITASSELGAQGSVAVTTLDLDPSRGLTALPSDLLDGDDALDRSCSRESFVEGNRFVVTGRGGIPLAPNELDAVSFGYGATASLGQRWLSLTEAGASTVTPKPAEKTVVTAFSTVSSLEASTWQRGASGEVQLVGNAIASPPQPHCAESALKENKAVTGHG